jgi:hypothetical protein
MSLYEDLQQSVMDFMKVKEVLREEDAMLKDMQSGVYYKPEVSAQ